MSRRARALAAFGLQTVLWISPAWAQHADAGVERQAARPSSPEHKPAEPSGVLPKVIDPNQLSEATRANLQERAASRRAGSAATSPAVSPATPPSAQRDPSPASAAPPTPAPRHVTPNEPARARAQMQRVQAVETGEGVTLLSNRIRLLPAPSLAAQTTHQRFADPPSLDRGGLVSAQTSSDVTEMHSLRPSSARTLSGKSTGLGWLLWPFVLFVATGAVVGTLWFRKKTD